MDCSVAHSSGAVKDDGFDFGVVFKEGIEAEWVLILHLPEKVYVVKADKITQDHIMSNAVTNGCVAIRVNIEPEFLAGSGGGKGSLADTKVTPQKKRNTTRFIAGIILQDDVAKL